MTASSELREKRRNVRAQSWFHASREETSERRGGVEPAAEGRHGFARRPLLQEFGDGLRQLAVAHRRRRRVQSADPEAANDLVVMPIVGTGNQLADTGQQSGYWQVFLLDLRPAGNRYALLPCAPVKLKTPPASRTMLTGLRAVASTRMAEAPALENTIRSKRFGSGSSGFFPLLFRNLRATIAGARRCLHDTRRTA